MRATESRSPRSGRTVGSTSHRVSASRSIAGCTASHRPRDLPDIVIVGSSVFDNTSRKDQPPGDVRGFDAEPVGRSGRFNRSRRRAPSETTRGRASLGVYSGQHERLVGHERGRDARIRVLLARPRRTTSTAVIASATTCSPTASSASTRLRERESGTFNSCITDSGTTICRRRLTWSTSRWPASA